MSKPIRILHVSPGLGSGGVGKMIQQWYTHTEKTKFEYEIATLGDDGILDNDLINKGCNIHRIRPIREIGILKYIKQFNEIFKNNKYDIVHSHMGIASFLVFIPAMMNGIHIRFLHAHNNKFDIDSQKGIQGLFINVIKAINVFFATEYCACTKEASEYFFTNRITSKNNINITLNGIDVDEFKFNSKKRDQLRKEFGVENKFIIGNVGRFHDQKNQEFLINIFYHIQQNKANSILWLVGEGDDKNLLERKCESLGISDKVFFMGVRLDVNTLMLCMDVFAMPSKYEGLGIAAIEAQASGLWCYVSTNVPKEVQITDLVEFISLDRDASEWARCILTKKEYQRTDTSKNIHDSGYDISACTQLLNEKYEMAMKNN